VVILKPFYTPWNTFLSFHCRLYLPVCMGYNKKRRNQCPLASRCVFNVPVILSAVLSCANSNDGVQLPTSLSDMLLLLLNWFIQGALKGNTGRTGGLLQL